MLLAITLSFNKHDKNGIIFILIFNIMWIGSIVITLNAQFLGANVSIFQSMCLLGYCVFPINIAAIVLRICKFLPLIFKIVIALAAFLWSSLCNILMLIKIFSFSRIYESNGS